MAERRILTAASISAAAFYFGTSNINASQSIEVGNEEPPIPAGIQEQYRISGMETVFGFSEDWDTDEIEALKTILDNTVLSLKTVFGREPISIGNDSPVLITIIKNNSQEGFLSRTNFPDMTDEIQIELGTNHDAETIEWAFVNELAFAFWGPLRPEDVEHGRPYTIFHRGMVDGVTASILGLQYTEDIIRETVAMEYDPEIANMPGIGTYREQHPALNDVRRILAMRAFYDALEEDPRFVQKFRDGLIEEYIGDIDHTDFMAVDVIRSMAQQAYAGDFEALIARHHVLEEPIIGEVVVGGPMRLGSDTFLGVTIFNRADGGFIEEPIENVNVEVTIYLNDENGTVIFEDTLQTNSDGIVFIDRSLSETESAGVPVYIRVESLAGSFDMQSYMDIDVDLA